TMDSFEGTSVDPGSLHKYVYTANDPINKIDPSGFTSSQELQTTQTSLQRIATSFISNISRILNADSKFKVFEVFFVTGPTIPRLPSHWFIYVNTIALNIGFRYDVGIDNPDEFQDGGKEVYFKSWEGFIQVTKTTKAAVEKDSFKTIRIALFSVGQYALWHTIVTKAPMPLGRREKEEINYRMCGINCYTWSLYAAGLSKIIERLPL
ncbi:MAG: hypothetical protein AB1414_21480, partial [bacterium]